MPGNRANGFQKWLRRTPHPALGSFSLLGSWCSVRVLGSTSWRPADASSRPALAKQLGTRPGRLTVTKQARSTGLGSRVLRRWPGLLGWRAAGWAAKRPLVLCMRLGRVRHGRGFSYLKRQAADLVDAALYAGAQRPRVEARSRFWIPGCLVQAWAFGGFDEASVDDRVATDPALGKAVASRRG